MKSALPVSQLGYGALVGAVTTYGLGWWLGWIEFVVISLAFLLAFGTALPFVLGGEGLDIERELSHRRVGVGGGAASVLTIRNTGRSRTAPRMVEDRIGERRRTLDVPALAAGADTKATAKLPTANRGVLRIGPAAMTRSDPLGLLRRDLSKTPVSELWIHPRHVALAPLRSGFAKDLEGPTFDSSPAGDVAFHTIREYETGDDIRHVHWMSTARTGSLMVRHFVDNRRPYLGVVVDTDPAAMAAAGFEVALGVAASHIVSAAEDSRPLALWVGSQEILTKSSPADRNMALDRLCLSEQDDQFDLGHGFDRLRSVDTDVSAMLLVTGERSPRELLSATRSARRRGAVIIARMLAEDAAPISVPGCVVLDCRGLEHFASLWRSVVR